MTVTINILSLNCPGQTGECIPTEIMKTSVVVYGATPAGIIAAVTASGHGAEVILVEPSKVLGGMYSSGLNTAEIEHMIDDVITGRAREFYINLGSRYYDSAYFQTFQSWQGTEFQKR